MSEKPGFIAQITGVFYKPQTIFTSIDEDDLSKGLLIVFLMVALAAYSSMLYMGKLPLEVLSPQLVGVDTSQFEGTMGVFAGIGAGVSITLGWTASTLLIHGLGRLSGGSGSMRRMFTLHGYASVPGLLNQFLRVVDALRIESSKLTGYYYSYTGIESKILTSLMGSNLLNIWGLATIALLVTAVNENYEVSRGRAVLIVLLPSLVYFIFNYFVGAR